MTALVDELRRLGERNGLVALGVAEARPFTNTEATLQVRKRAGRHGEMQFTYRNPARSRCCLRVA